MLITRGGYDIVSPNSIMLLEAKLEGSLMDEEMRTTLKALWLAAQTEGFKLPWLFEGIAEDYPPALMARDAILQRREIKRPPTQ